MRRFFEFWIVDCGLWIEGTGLRVQIIKNPVVSGQWSVISFEFWIVDCGLWIEGAGVRVQICVFR
jgi:hypothetical protein